MSHETTTRPELAETLFLSKDTRVAIQAVLAGATHIKALHHSTEDQLQTIYKETQGDTPVTLADQRSERAALDTLYAYFPQDSVNAEETGFNHGTSDRLWYLDPLDGTFAFRRAHKDSSIGLLLTENGIAQTAAVCLPLLDIPELIIAQKGKGAHRLLLDPDFRLNNHPSQLSVSSQSLQDKDSVIYWDPNFNQKAIPHKLHMLQGLTDLITPNLWQLRTPGSNINLQVQIASGNGELGITDFVGGPYDTLIGALIVQEAGGQATDIFGNPIQPESQVAIYSNGRNHSQLLEIAQHAYHGYQGFK